MNEKLHEHVKSTIQELSKSRMEDASNVTSCFVGRFCAAYPGSGSLSSSLLSRGIDIRHDSFNGSPLRRKLTIFLRRSAQLCRGGVASATSSFWAFLQGHKSGIIGRASLPKWAVPRCISFACSRVYSIAAERLDA
jgi:hypothetical protein